MATSSKHLLAKQIDDVCKVVIPSHITPRFACIIVQDEELIIGESKVDAVLIGHVAVLRGDNQAAWIPLDKLSVPQLRSVLSTVKRAARRQENVRAINPFWFIGNDSGAWLHKVMEQSYEDYLKTIQV